MVKRKNAPCRGEAAALIGFVLLLLALALATPGATAVDAAPPLAGKLSQLKQHLGPKDALLATTAENRRLVAVNADRLLVPASTLKILTAVVALEVLGPNFRFPTRFFFSRENDLIVKGYGDPLLVSEALDDMAAMLETRLQTTPRTIRDLVVDDSYFSPAIAIPGVQASAQPYDAPNGALCANFNTVVFKTEGGRRVSAEPQTPLLGFARKRIPLTGAAEGRITLSHHHGDIPLYAGHLLKFFLARRGVTVSGRVRRQMDQSSKHSRVLEYLSADPLTRVVAKMLTYSNNFMANQLLIASGAARYGVPGSLEKGVRTARDVARGLGIEDVFLVEGAGISRRNRVRAADLDRVLAAFAPHMRLMRNDGPEHYKTGTLAGIRTRAGYIDTLTRGRVRYVILINTPGRSMGPVIRKLRSILLSVD